MPSITKIFLSLGLAFAMTPFTSSAPATESISQTNVETGLPHLSYEIGFYNASDPKRATPPPQCNFGGARTEFTYIDINTYGDGTACIGYAGYPTCGLGQWGHD